VETRFELRALGSASLAHGIVWDHQACDPPHLVVPPPLIPFPAMEFSQDQTRYGSRPPQRELSVKHRKTRSKKATAEADATNCLFSAGCDPERSPVRGANRASRDQAPGGGGKRRRLSSTRALANSSPHPPRPIGFPIISASWGYNKCGVATAKWRCEEGPFACGQVGDLVASMLLYPPRRESHAKRRGVSNVLISSDTDISCHGALQSTRRGSSQSLHCRGGHR
jgi:hypothetical protein